MRLRLKFFASLRERAKASELTREFPDGSTVNAVWLSMVREFPALEAAASRISYAVNLEYVEPDFKPRDNDELAFIPPVSGGSEAPWVGPIEITREPIDLQIVELAVADPASGAVVSFAGTVRNENAGRQVIKLEYEAYEPMALGEIRRIAEEAGERWPLSRVAVAHRIGVLEIGEISVAIAVSAPHRGEAFEACRFVIDRIKEIVPIWKKEHFEGGELWVGCQTSHPPER